MRQTTFNGIKEIDVNVSFADDTKGFWESFRSHDPGLLPTDISSHDPDAKSKLLRSYHRILWSRELPNGEFMDLAFCPRMDDYLQWRGHRFGSDSLTNSFRYTCMQDIINQYRAEFDDYRSFMESYIRIGYTIGGMTIFPKPHKGEAGRSSQTMNQTRGCNNRIKDRWDRTLECIRLHYLGRPNPLENVLGDDSWFYDKFIDFQGYVDFFFLQDCVTSDYSEVVSWLGDMDFDTPALPRDVDEYRIWIDANMDFVRRRNRRIASFVESRRSGPPL